MISGSERSKGEKIQKRYDKEACDGIENECRRVVQDAKKGGMRTSQSFDTGTPSNQLNFP